MNDNSKYRNTTTFKKGNKIHYPKGRPNPTLSKKVELNAHHQKSFYQIINDNNIKTWEDSLKCSELWNLENGLTLCIECHNKTKLGVRQFLPKRVVEEVSQVR